MQVQLRDNVFTATQWFKDGDHPAVYCDQHGVNRIAGTGFDEYGFECSQLDYGITPGQWIVEIFDEIHRYDDEEFRQMFEPATICIGTLAGIKIEVPDHSFGTCPVCNPETDASIHNHPINSPEPTWCQTGEHWIENDYAQVVNGMTVCDSVACVKKAEEIGKHAEEKPAAANPTICKARTE
jgi:hypothetical protein